MISDELLAELKQILWEDYQIQLTDKDLKLFAENLKGIFSQLIQAISRKREILESTVKSKLNNDQSNQA